MKNKKIILTYGTFDLFHVGHLKLLQRAKSLGNELIVGVSTDEFNSIKNKKTIIPFKHRLEIISNIKCVDKVIAEENWEQKVYDIKKYNVNTLVMGDDWKGKFDNLREFCEIVYINRTKNISSTQLKQTMKTFSISKQEILKAFDILEQLKEELQ